MNYLKKFKENQQEDIKQQYQISELKKQAKDENKTESSVDWKKLNDWQRFVALRFGLDSASEALTSKWNPIAMTPQAYIKKEQRSLVSKSRSIVGSNDYGKGFLRMVIQNVIGERGVRFQSATLNQDNTLNVEVNDAIEKSWKEWGRADNCDVAGQMSLIEIQKALITSLVTDGEFFVRMHEDGDTFKLQLLDAQRCNPNTVLKHKNDSESMELNGIVYEKKTRKPLQYLFSDDFNFKLGTDHYSETDSVAAIPASEIIHGFITEGINQTRGLPLIKTAIERLYSLDKYEEASLINARVSAAKMGFFENTGEEDGAVGDDENTDISGEPGSFTTLPVGLSLAAWNPDYPHGEFPTFLKAMLRAVSSSMGVNYNTLANDLEGVNYSSMRQGALTERDYWKILQQFLVEKFFDRIYRRWLGVQLQYNKISAKSRRLKIADIEKYYEVSWTPRRWMWVDPRNETDANVKNIRGFLVAPSTIIRQQGEDPHEVIRQCAADINMMRDEGIPDNFIEAFFIGKTAAAETIENESEGGSEPEAVEDED